MKKLIRYIRIVPIDVLVYRMTKAPAVLLGALPFEVDEIQLAGKVAYTIHDDERFVHRSFVYEKVHLLKLLGKHGPAIGNCVTSQNYRGQSIYPKMIQRIATHLLSHDTQEVFIIVNSDNTASIRGIEKAGFELYASVKAKRFLLFYFDKKINRFG
jgi:RimJ/RimL family protein N-acetyltransferase